MRQSRVALRYFGFWPRSWSLRRLLPAPAATGILPTLSLRILPQMPEPIPRRFAECVCLVLPQHSSAFPIIRLGQLPASFREHDFPRVGFRGCSYFLMFRPPSLLASQIVSTAVFIAQGSRGFYIRAERASLPSHASDMLSARQQAISGTRTFISQDSQPCRLLPNDADVSIALPKIPYGGFSPVRLQGRYIRQGFPVRRISHAGRFASVLRAPRFPRRNPRSVPGDAVRWNTSVRAASAALPQGPSLRSGLCCPGPSTLNRPHPSHSRAHPDFTA
jgi:hypothetical protein